MSLCVLDSTPALAALSSSGCGDSPSSSPTTQWYKEKHQGRFTNKLLYGDQALVDEDGDLLGTLGLLRPYPRSNRFASPQRYHYLHDDSWEALTRRGRENA
jgi:hypothetical protein